MDKEWLEDWEKEQKAAEEKAKESIPSWIERGKALIFPERYEEWEQCVQVRAKDLYHGMDLDAALEIMEVLDKGASIEEAKKILDDQNHSGMSDSIVRNIIFHFSSKGPEFWEATSFERIPLETRRIIKAKKKENKQLAEAHAKTNGSRKHM